MKILECLVSFYMLLIISFNCIIQLRWILKRKPSWLSWKGYNIDERY